MLSFHTRPYLRLRDVVGHNSKVALDHCDSDAVSTRMQRGSTQTSATTYVISSPSLLIHRWFGIDCMSEFVVAMGCRVLWKTRIRASTIQ